MAYPLAFSQAISILVYVALKHAAGKGEDFTSVKTISSYLGIPAPSVTKVIGALVGRGILETREGVRGGVGLAKPLEEISFLSVLDAMDHSAGLFKMNFATIQDDPEYRPLITDIQQSLQNAESAMRESLESRTLADILKPYLH